MMTRIGTETALVGTAKSMSVAPAGMKTVAGGLTILGSLLTSLTVMPPAGAAPSQRHSGVDRRPADHASLLRLAP